MRRFILVLALWSMGGVTAQAAAETRVKGNLPVADSAALESTEGLETEYGVVTTSEGLRLRSYITRPEGTADRLPALFVTQWVSCGSMKFRADRDSEVKLLAKQSGMAMIRIDRAGSGDSEGPGCDKLDYDTEVRHYREALTQVKRHPWIDPERIVIFGSSLGSTTAPLVAQGNDAAGVVVQGGGAVTYLERMINFERLYVERSGKVKPEDIHGEMVRRIAFLVHYLTGKMTPQQIAAAHPQLGDVWVNIRGAEGETHYGRPLSWHQQAASRNFLAAWLSLGVPVMVAYGEYDQFEMRHGHRMIVDMLNQQQAGRAQWLEIRNADHGLELYADEYDAYVWKDGVRAPQLFVKPAVKWLKQITSVN